MSLTLFAQPYDITACGFYFRSIDEYTERYAAVRNETGNPVEEYEIQMIDGDPLNSALFEALQINQANLYPFLDRLDEWDEHDKHVLIIAIGECGETFNIGTDDPSILDLDLYEIDTLRDLAEQFVEEGLFGEIPEPLSFYIDYDAIARDLAADYVETSIAGRHFVYRLG